MISPMKINLTKAQKDALELIHDAQVQQIAATDRSNGQYPQGLARGAEINTAVSGRMW
jgi:hypothetical protein